MRTAALIALLGAVCLAQDTIATKKPACNAKTRGDYWPAEANSSPQAVRRFTQSGELEMCSRDFWKYKWVHLSINAHNFAKENQPINQESKPAGAESSK
jgi:hypothetical protein